MPDFTKEQLAIHRSMVSGESSIIRALAGTGKSTTIVSGIDKMMENPRFKAKKGLLTAFNKKIQVELEEKLKHQPNWTVRTLNSLGMGTLLANGAVWNGGNLTVDTGKKNALVEMALDTELSQTLKEDLKPLQMGNLLPDILSEIFTKARVYGYLPNKLGNGFSHVLNTCELEGFDPNRLKDSTKGGLLTLVIAMLKANIALAKNEGVIDFDDQIYLTLLCPFVGRRWDIVVLDEGQDSSEVNLKQITGACKKQLIVIGDENQTLFQFRGAKDTILDRFVEEWGKITGTTPNTSLKLTKTFRCPKSVVMRQHDIIQDSSYRGIKERGHGMVQIPLVTTAKATWSFRHIESKAATSTAMLAPFNRDIYIAVALIMAENRKNPVGHVKDTYAFLCEPPSYHLLSSARKFKGLGLSTPLEITLSYLKKIIMQTGMSDREIHELFWPSDEPDGKILMSTVHRTKGGEWDDVFLLNMDSYKPTGNIRYVAETRTIKRLMGLDYSYYGPFISANETNKERESRIRAAASQHIESNAYLLKPTSNLRAQEKKLAASIRENAKRHNPTKLMLQTLRELDGKSS